VIKGKLGQHREALDGSAANHNRDTFTTSRSILTGRDWQAVLDQRRADDPWLYPWHNSCSVGYRQVLT
jgi:hypothetical protein